jgi:hypothetical protein
LKEGDIIRIGKKVIKIKEIVFDDDNIEQKDK